MVAIGFGYVFVCAYIAIWHVNIAGLIVVISFSIEMEIELSSMLL